MGDNQVMLMLHRRLHIVGDDGSPAPFDDPSIKIGQRNLLIPGREHLGHQRLDALNFFFILSALLLGAFPFCRRFIAEKAS